MRITRIKLATIVAVLLGVSLSYVSGPLQAQLPMPASTQFDMTGFLQEATLGGVGTGGGAGALQGGSLKVNGHTVIVPSNTIVILPASAYTWEELFSRSPAPYTNLATGLAMNDVPTPLTTWEVHVVGNRVLGGAGGADLYIAGLMDIHQASLSSGSGFINFMDYGTGEMRVGGVIGDNTTGARVRLSDPVGRFGRAMFADARFAVDDANPTMTAGTGFPMCFPRTDPLVFDDPLCPQSQRPIIAAGPPVVYASSIRMTNPALLPLGGALDPRLQAPFEVGDYVTYAGTLVSDTTGIAGPWPVLGVAGTYVSAHTIGNNIAIYTSPGTNPAYVSIEVGLIGTGGLTAIGAGEAAIRTKFEGMTTDPSRNIHLYGVDITPITGVTTDRDFGTIGVDPGPAGGGAVEGRWRFRPPCTAGVATVKACTPPPAGTFLPPPREVRAVIEGLQSQVVALGANDLTKTTANGIFYGQYHAPIGEYIFPENVPGSPIVENNFNTIDFLVKGGYSSSTGVIALGELDPWPSNIAPIPVCTPPTANAGGPYTVALGGSITLIGSATGGTGPFTYAWTATGGSFSNPAIAGPVFSSVGAVSPVGLSFTVTNACGANTQPTTVTINTPLAPTVAHVAPIVVNSGAVGSFIVSGTDPNLPAATPLTFTVTQTGGPALLAGPSAIQLTPTSATVSFTAPTLPVGQVVPSVINLTITARNTLGLTSAPEFTTITVNPIPDNVLITNAEYRTGKQRLAITATSSVVSPNVILKLNPYVCAVPQPVGAPACAQPANTFDPATLGNTFVNNGGGLYTITLVGAPEPAIPPALPLTVTSNLGTTSSPHGLDRIRQ
jgi:hypothetical protein